MAADRSWRWIAWPILGIGGVIVAGGMMLGYGSLRLVLHGARAAGEVSSRTSAAQPRSSRPAIV